MSGLALGAAALGNLLLPYSPIARAVCGAVSAVLVIMITLRIAFDFQAVRAELKNPAILAVFPTFFMALMLLATYLKPYAAAPAKALWVAALVLQLLVSAVFLVRFVGAFKLAQVLPSWFLIFVGFVVASVTSPAFEAVALGRILAYAGMAGYVAILPVVVYRMVKAGDLPEPVLPTVVIFAAPPSLCLVGYLAVAPVKQVGVVYALLGMAAVSLLYVFTRLPRILTNRFCPSCSALTFPIVISAIAFKQSSLFFATAGAGPLAPPGVVAAIDAAVVLLVAYVAVRYAFLLLSPGAEPQLAAEPATA
jgi:exfoliative toxin A/B